MQRNKPLWAVAARAVLIGWAFTSAASAIDFDGYTGPIQLNLSYYNTRTLYDTESIFGPGGSGSRFGELTLNTEPVIGAAQGALPGEDTWSILRVESIRTITGPLPAGVELYNRTTASTEITGIMVQGRDTSLSVQNAGRPDETQRIHSAGTQIAFFEDTAKNFDPTSPPGQRTSHPVQYPTVTDGRLVWTLNAIPGFNGAFPDDESFTTLLPNAGQTVVIAYSSFRAEFGPTVTFGEGEDNDQFEDLPDQDIEFGLTAKRSDGDWWFVGESGSARAHSAQVLAKTISTPEPTTTSLFGIVFVFAIATMTHRKRPIA